MNERRLKSAQFWHRLRSSSGGYYWFYLYFCNWRGIVNVIEEIESRRNILHQIWKPTKGGLRASNFGPEYLYPSAEIRLKSVCIIFISNSVQMYEIWNTMPIKWAVDAIVYMQSQNGQKDVEERHFLVQIKCIEGWTCVFNHAHGSCLRKLW